MLFPLNGPMTQGTVFTCAVAEDYPDSVTHGLVITARCDVSNDKVQTFNYLPIVSLNDWLSRAGRVIISQRLMKETVGKMKSTLVEAGYSTSILGTESPHSVLQTLFPPGKGSAEKMHVRFQDLCARYDLATLGVSDHPPNGACIQVAKAAPKLRDSMISELVHQQLAGHYFLSQIRPDGDDAGYVVLLREIHALPRTAAHAISDGLDANCFAEMCAGEPGLRGRLRVASGELAMPLSVVRSPNIEHLMQAFSLLFNRIGIADPDPNYITQLWIRQPGNVEIH